MQLKTIITVILMAFLLQSCKSDPKKVQQAVRYTCPMDTAVFSSKPGKCPKCGMQLVLKSKPAQHVH